MRGARHGGFAAAQANGGWFTQRHVRHPTVDFPARLVPAAASLLQEVVDRRIIPAAAARCGFAAGHLVCPDLFFVWYTAQPGGQAGLGEHADGSVLSFNLLLNDPADFDGGGPERHTQPPPCAL